MFNMRKCAFTCLAALFVALASYGQKTTKNNHTGNWESGSSWVGAVPAAVTNIGSGDLDLTINGFITRNGDLSISGNTDAEDFIINDTLVIIGNLSLPNKAANLILGPAAVFIVIGDFSASNKIVVENGGIFVVTGDMNFSPSGQDDYDDGGSGELFVGGSVGGNDDAEGGESNWDNLDDQYPVIYDYVVCGGGPSCVLPVRMLYFNAKSESNVVKLEWATSQEENFYKFIVQRSIDGVLFEDIGEVRGKGFNIYGIKTEYSFVDDRPFLGHNYYRLKAVDVDETSEYFGVKAVNMKGAKTLAVAPNPASGQTVFFQTNFNPQESDRVILTNGLGVEIFNGPASTLQNRIDLDHSPSPGIYILHYVSKDFGQSTRVVFKD
jgi:hypothetical protein